MGQERTSEILYYSATRTRTKTIWTHLKLVYTTIKQGEKEVEEVLPNTEPRMMPIPRPLLSIIFRQGTGGRKQKFGHCKSIHDHQFSP